jgi:DNA-binding transcriptional MerR regulator/methylmalonyl-CoA mutase cobalamin-binding subunit
VSDGDDRWRIKEFAAIVGVQEETLRAWERRYGLLAPERTAGGFRLYSKADERRIRSMQAHMARGLAAAQAAQIALAESARTSVPPARADDVVDEMLAAAEPFDATRLDALLDVAFEQGTVAAIRDVVLPVLVQIGLRWERGEMSVAQEHFASSLVERRLLTLAGGWESGDGPLALLACPSGERHTLGLICLGLVLADRGWRIAYLGADTPVAEIAAASASLSPDVVVLCSFDARRLSADADAIADLGRGHRTILAGRGVTAELARQTGVERAPGDPMLTASVLADTVAAGSRASD